MVLKYLFLVMLLSGCIPRGIPIEIYQAVNPIDPKKIICPYKYNNDAFIKAIQIEGELSMSEAMILWESYKNSGRKNLSNYLIAVNYYYLIRPFGFQDRVYLELVKRIKARAKILKRIRIRLVYEK